MRNHLKMPWIPCDHLVSEMQRSGTDQQILKRDLDTLTLLLAVNPSGQESDLLRERMHRYVGYQLLNERLAARPDLRCIGTMNPMHQLDQAIAESAVSWLPMAVKI